MSKNTWFDPFYLYDLLNDEEVNIQKNVRNFCKNELLPNVIENNRNIRAIATKGIPMALLVASNRRIIPILPRINS